MTIKFIRLTSLNGQVNYVSIKRIENICAIDSTETVINFTSGNYTKVLETPQEILKIIENSQYSEVNN